MQCREHAPRLDVAFVGKEQGIGETTGEMRLEPGENRNFDLRREFRSRLLAAPIASTSVLVGGFMELLLRGRLLDTE